MNPFKAAWNFVFAPHAPRFEELQEKIVIDVRKSNHADNAEVVITYQSSKDNVAEMEKVLRNQAYTLLSRLSGETPENIGSREKQ